jgi:hypothetical protein
MMFSDLPSPAVASSQTTNRTTGFAQAGNRYASCIKCGTGFFGIMLWSPRPFRQDRRRSLPCDASRLLHQLRRHKRKTREQSTEFGTNRRDPNSSEFLSASLPAQAGNPVTTGQQN